MKRLLSWILISTISLILGGTISFSIGPRQPLLITVGIIFILLEIGLIYLGISRKRKSRAQAKPPLLYKAGYLAFAMIAFMTLVQSGVVGDLPQVYKTGVEAYEAESWDEAIEQFESVVTTDPDYENVETLLSVAKGKRDEILFNQANGIYLVAQKQLNSERFESAIDTLSIATRILEQPNSHPESAKLKTDMSDLHKKILDTRDAKIKRQEELARAAKKKEEDRKRQAAKKKQKDELAEQRDAIMSKMKEALAQMEVEINQFNRVAGQTFFKSCGLRQSGQRCEITVSDLWYALPPQDKERMIVRFANQYALIASRAGLRGDTPNEANYPTTSFVDTYKREVAFSSTFRTKVVR